MTLWRPSAAWEGVTGDVPDAMAASSLKLLAYLLIVVSSIVFGAAHYLSGAGWDIGKVSEAALDGVALDVRPGEIFGLLGPNGAGKTTLVRSIVGRVVPDSGTVRVFGDDAGSREAARSRGWVPQEIALYALLTPAENLWTFGRYQGLAGRALEEAITRSLDWSGLSDRRKDRTGKLSGGMRRRLNIAAGTIHDPRLLLLDEPTAGLDFVGITSMLHLLGGLHQTGTTIVISTHDTDLAYEWAEEAWVIMNGRIAAQGPITEVMQEREILREAHLRVPWLVETGLAMQKTHPDLLPGPLPRSRDQMIARILG